MAQCSLQKWLHGVVVVDDADCMISSISSDSRDVEPGAAFLAYPGSFCDGRDYIEQALEKGASAILYEPPLSQHSSLGVPVPMIPVPGLEARRGMLAARFYGCPSRAMTTIGITGTNGKTSCADFIAQAFSHSGLSCGVVGTLGAGVWPQLIPTGMTTVDAVPLQRSLFHMQCAEVACAAIEVSSHALVLGRLDATELDVAVFTQLSRDHLDFHGSMDAYMEAKMSLFQHPGLRTAVVNVDDACGQQIVAQYSQGVPMVGVSLQPHDDSSIPLVVATYVIASAGGYELYVRSPWGEGKIALSLLGKFNIYNALLVAGVLGSLDWSWEQIVAALTALQPVPGRMQCFGGGALPSVVVDYAHTPDALEQVLMSLTAHCKGELWCVFGSGGDRDVGKRPLMAAAVERYADHVIVTNDNPRNESPQEIADDIVAGFQSQLDVEVELGRSKAIHRAIQRASAQDVVLVAGKGHETTQIIGDRVISCSDALSVAKELKIRGRHV